MAKVNGTFYTAERLRRGTTPVSPPYDGSEGQQPPVTPSVKVTPPVAIRYASEAAMIADQANQRSGYLYFDGTNTWWYLGVANGVIGDYKAFGGGSKWTDGAGFIYRDSPVVIGQTTLPTGATFAVKSKTSGNANIFQLIDDTGTDVVEINNLGVYSFPFSDFSIGVTGISNSHFKYRSSLNGVNTTIFSIIDSLDVPVAFWGANGNYYQKSVIFKAGTTAASTGFIYQSGSTSGGNKDFLVRNGAGSEGFYMKGDLGFVVLNPRMSIGSASASVVNGVYIQGNSTTAQIFGVSNSTPTRQFDVFGNGRIAFYNLPTASAGLTSGMIWNDAGTLKII